MRNLKFKYAAAWNFLPFGPDGIRFDFANYGNIILVSGENRDAKAIDSDALSNEAKISSNGTGKSSFQEIIVYCLFGKTVKRPEQIKNNVIHNLVKKDCRTEVVIDNFRVVRTRFENGDPKKNSLRIWESDQGIWDKSTEITLGTMSLTQKEIDKRLGLTYDAFVNMCIFTDDQRACFLECDNPTKRDIVENLLSLGEYRDWAENAKEFSKEIKAKIAAKSKEFEMLLSNKTDAERRLNLTQVKDKDWFITKQNEIATMEKTILSKSKQLATTDNGVAILAYQTAQEKIKEINGKLPSIEEAKVSNNKKLQAVKEKELNLKSDALSLVNQYNTLQSQVKSKIEERKKKESEIADLQSATPGTRCGKCRGIVEEQNIASYIQGLQREINGINLDAKAIMESAKVVGKNSDELKLKQNKITEMINLIVSKISESESQIRILHSELTSASQVREPKADSSELLLEQQREELQKQLDLKKKELKGPSPFQDILDNDKSELDKIIKNVSEKEAEVQLLEAELPYILYWMKGFGEDGIRRWVVDGIIPELNNRINYWLQFLIDNRITLKFDNELNEKIERNPVDGDPYIYHAMSAGQRRRLNLAVSQSFAHVMTLSSGSVPSIIFLDEVTTNVDPLGVQGIYNMISELAQDKQVFVTTHDPDLVQMLQGTDVIKLVHENGFTKLIDPS